MGQRRLDRLASERVLRRAVELADATGEDPDTFAVEALVEAAAELGISGTAVHRAVAEEQAGLLAGDPSRVDRLVGPAVISAARLVPFEASKALDLLDEWLRRQWAFRRVRSGETVAEYRRRTDVVAAMQRTARSVTGRENGEKVRNLRVIAYDLSATAGSESNPVAGRIGEPDVEGSPTPTSVVALVVDVESSRSFAEMGGTVVAAGGTVLSVIPAGATAMWSLLGIPASGAIGAGVMLARKAWTGGIDVALEGLLDRVEAGEAPPSVIGGLTDRIKRPG